MLNHHLPRTVVPRRYDLVLDVDIKSFSYSGFEKIFVNVSESVKEVFLNSVGLDVNSVFFENSDGIRIGASVVYEKESERIKLLCNESLSVGDWVLFVDFRGVILDNLIGFYRSKFKDKDGVEKWLATTQFEPTGARYAFPCWDEPDFKAVFSVCLISDSNFVRISNEGVSSEKVLDDGRVETRFVDSVLMSTYLVAFVIGPLEISSVGSVGNTKLRIIHRPGFSDVVGFSGSVALKVLDFFEDYYDIAYPGSKLDLIAIPDFSSGAMENLGAITFRENLLLLNEGIATRRELSRSAEVIAHEFAHMWFGDLVTMFWWDGLWLNEAFASLMECIAVDAIFPEFKIFGDLNLSRSAGFSVDCLRSSRPVEFDVSSPSEAEQMFDVLTYEKGSSVLRMFQMFVGEDVFREGVRKYLNDFKFSNTYSTDLWNCLSEVSGIPLDDMLPSWIRKEGFPCLSFSSDGSNWIFSQSRYLIDRGSDDSLWLIPFSLKDLKSGKILNFNFFDKSLSVKYSDIEVPFLNVGGWGFYYSFYSKEQLRKVLDFFDSLDSNEKYRLLEDCWAGVRVGKVDLDLFFEVLNFYKNEKDVNLWCLICSYISVLDRLIDDSVRVSFKIWVSSLVSCVFDFVGFEPDRNESQELKQLRSFVVRLKAFYGDGESLIDRAVSVFNDGSIDSVVDGNFYSSILSLSAFSGVISVEVFLEKFRSAKSPQIENRFLQVLSSIKDERTSKVVVDAMLNGTVRASDVPYVLASLIADKKNGFVAWNLFVKNFDRLISIMTTKSSSHSLYGLSNIYDKKLSDIIIPFIEKKPLPSSEKISSQKLEHLKANVLFAESLKGKLSSELFIRYSS